VVGRVIPQTLPYIWVSSQPPNLLNEADLYLDFKQRRLVVCKGRFGTDILS